MGLMSMMGVGMGWTADNGHPRELLLFMGCLCNVFFRWYVIAAKKTQRTYEERTKKENYRWIAERSPWFAVGLADKDCQ